MVTEFEFRKLQEGFRKEGPEDLSIYICIRNIMSEFLVVEDEAATIDT